MKTRAIIALVLLSVLSSTFAHAADEYNTATGLTAAGAPLGLHGADPVAFVDIGNRIAGTAAHTAVHDGVAYYFSRDSNKQTFEKAPAKYLP
jgi:YHS domain-containing protein